MVRKGRKKGRAEWGAVGTVLSGLADARWGPGAWTQKQLAAGACLPEASVSRHFRRDRLSLDAALKYADFFGCNVRVLSQRRA